jgi:uncharacterized protein (TIGR03435 family)
MSKLQRRIYSALLRLHPAAFRDQFGRDMARDCEDAIRDRGFAALIGDAFLSLARQWKSRALAGPEPEMEPAVAGHPFLSGRYIVVTHSSSFTAFDLVSASILSMLLLLTIGYAASVPNRCALADLQTLTVSHDGGLDTGGNTPPPIAANIAGHREAPGDGGLIAPGSGTAHYKGVVSLSRAVAPPVWRQRASGGPRATEPLLNAFRQLALISIIVWITSLLLRRIPNAGRRVAVGALGLLSIAASVAFGAVPKPPTHAQILHASAPLPSFEVATVKPWQPPARPVAPAPIAPGAPDLRPAGPPRKIDPMGGGRAAGQRTDRIHIIGQAAILIQFAFNLTIGSENQIIGAPGWANSESDRYEVQAKIDDATFAALQKMTPEQQHEQVALMEQSLLADRFKLKVHFETREQPAYALVVAKGGAKLTPAKEGEHSQLSSSSTDTSGTAVTLDDFVRSPLLRPEGRIVINQTGLTGAYDFTVKAEPGPDPPSFFTLIEEQLGLKLVPTKAPVEVIVIDHIEKPTEN